MICCCLLPLLAALQIHAQSGSVSLTGTNSASPLSNFGGDLIPTGIGVSYLTYTSTSTIPTISLSGSIALLASTIAEANGSTVSSSSSGRKTTSQSYSLLQGAKTPSSPIASLSGSVIGNVTRNATASKTSSTPAAPTNTQPCNNYPEFCSRSYSNITFVTAHNSPFVNPNNAAANQALGVIDQLNDGIRMLQGQTHKVNDTMYYCHTSCDLLNAGTVESYFASITTWVRQHPYDVVTILIGNSDLVAVGNYTGALEASGLGSYAYTPPKIPMAIHDWPTLSQLILSGKRVIIFMDYNANQTIVPKIIDEFSNMWETPFSPTNRSFPCTVQRPPGLSGDDARERMYMANHNLNTEIAIAGTSFLVPTTALLNQTNALNGTGSLGLMANHCVASWGRPPNFLLVDYYNEGSFPGSVFEVAAEMNNVTYSRACCGMVPSGASVAGPLHWHLMRTFILAMTLVSICDWL